MLSVAKAAKDYYLQKLGEVSPREDYYLRGGTATGTWRGSGAQETGLGGVVSAEGLVRLFDGQHPATGDQLGRRLRKDGVAAWDLTFSADKSVSLLWALGDTETRRQVMESFTAATESALGYLESVASSTRGAARHPVLDDDGQPVLNENGKRKMRVETWPIRSHGYVAASFTEFTSREDDPQLHTHVVVANKVKGVDGVWRALDGQLLYRHKLDAGYLHEAELRRQLTQRLGVRWRPVRNGVADIEGFTRTQIEEFSRRRQQIEAWIQAEQLTPSAAAYEAATLATRRTKADHPIDQLMPQWRERAAQVGLTPERIAATLEHSRHITAPDIEVLFADLAAPEGLTAKESTFARGEVIQAVAAALPEGGTREQMEDMADRFLGTSEVVPILPAHHGMSRLPDIPGLTDEERQVLEERVAPHGGTRGLRRRDGTLHPGLVHERRYTTAELLATEQRTITVALDGLHTGRFTPPQHLIDDTMRRRPHLTEGQTETLRHLATSGDAIDVAIGVAGSGKTTVMDAIRELAEATATPIIGAALSGRAAAELQEDSAISSFTITRLLGETQRTGGLRPRTVLVVDEAGMVGTRDLARLAALTDQAEGKLILAGDDHQLAEIDAGGLFTALANRLPTTELTENVRQDEQWERQALNDLRNGSVADALAEYHRHDRIVVEDSPADTLARAVTDWHTHVTDTGDIEGALLVAHHNVTVDELNRRARDHVAAAGNLHGPLLATGKRQYQAGDRVLCLKNYSRIGVLNGDLATITAVDPKQGVLAVRLDRHPDPVQLPAWYLDEGHVDHGYAVTCHKAQGATVDRAFVVGSDAITKEWGYVAMSRGRHANNLYLASPPSDDDCTHLTHHHTDEIDRFAATLRRAEAKSAAIDTGRGPQTTDDDELRRRLDQAEASLEPSADRSKRPPRDPTHVVEYAQLASEAESRHRDQIAAMTYQAPPWGADALGERPTSPRERAAWDRALETALRYRTRHCILDDATELLGAPPPTSHVKERADWVATQRAINRQLGGVERRQSRIVSRAL